MSNTTYLITGASRGIGLAFTRELLTKDAQARVIAAARNPDSAEQLQAAIKEFPGRIQTLKLDVEDFEGVKKAALVAESLSFAAEGIDVLVNNAGGIASRSLSTDDLDFGSDLSADLQLNLFGTISVTGAFLPLLRKGREKKIWFVSSIMGSLGHPFTQQAVAPAYSISKTALNAYGLKLAHTLRPEGFTIVLLHPGYVETDLTSGQSLAGVDKITVQESAKLSIAALKSKGKDDSGTFIYYENGEVLPW